MSKVKRMLDDVKNALPNANVREAKEPTQSSVIKANMNYLTDVEFGELIVLRTRFDYKVSVKRSGAGIVVIVKS